MPILAIETTGAACSVAFADGARVREHTRIAPRRHNALVLEMIDTLLASAGVRPRELEAVAFSAGPGSFTGVRIGAAVAQGIAFGAGVAVVRVATSTVMAEQVRRRCDAPGVTTVRPSRAGWVYAARYAFEDGAVVCEAFDALVPSDAVPRGSARGLAPSHEDQAPPGWLVAERDEPLRAAVLAELAGPMPRLDAAEAIPFYVPGDSPWKKMS